MTSKLEIKQFSKLLLKKYRDSEEMFIVEGKRLVTDGLQSNFQCLSVFVTNQFEKNEREFCKLQELDKFNYNFVNDKDFAKLTTTKNPQGIAAVFSIPSRSNITYDKRIICLENISDPGNVGTILRSCDWFGIRTVILSSSCADIYNPKVLRASMGAVFNLDIFEDVSLIPFISKLKSESFNSYYADLEGIDYRTVKFDGKFVITFCSEAFGPTDELKNICNNGITILKKGRIDSLNVAAAAAVILSSI